MYLEDVRRIIIMHKYSKEYDFVKDRVTGTELMILSSECNMKCYILFTYCLLTLFHPEEVPCMLVGTNRCTESLDSPQTASPCFFHLKSKPFSQLIFTSICLSTDDSVCSLPTMFSSVHLSLSLFTRDQEQPNGL
jgi:hypothetical protein